MKKNDVVELLKSMQGHVLSLTKSDTDHLIDIVNFCNSKGLIKQNVGGSYMLDSKGYDLIENKLDWDDLFEKKESTTIHIGHNIMGHNTFNHSDFSNNLNSEKTISTPPLNRSKLERIYWIVGILVGISLVIIGYLTMVKS